MADADDTKPCPACGEIIKVAALKCRFCGEDLEAFAEKHAAHHEVALFVGHPVALYSLARWFAAVFTLGVLAFVYWLRSRALTIEVTTQRIKMERGLFSKTKESLELFRVDHVVTEQSLGMRLLGYGVVRVATSDKNESHVLLYGLPHFEELAEKIRDCSLKERERRGIRAIAQV
ncbi:MAG TPA: PH domain-containing protein [Byssovorax sp.]|jgi:uncharacterized membrane protein YdbT with pleckstrin-like domain